MTARENDRPRAGEAQGKRTWIERYCAWVYGRASDAVWDAEKALATGKRCWNDEPEEMVGLRHTATKVREVGVRQVQDAAYQVYLDTRLLLNVADLGWYWVPPLRRLVVTLRYGLRAYRSMRRAEFWAGGCKLQDWEVRRG